MTIADRIAYSMRYNYLRNSFPHNSMTARATIAVLALLFAVAAFQGVVDNAWRTKKNDKGNRYEGSVAQQVAATSVVEMIGFHAFRQDFRPNQDVTLRVDFYTPEAAPKARVTARELHRKSFYWMEAKQQSWKGGWNRFAPWPVRDVLRNMEIGSDELLVLVRLDGFSTGGGAVAPAFVSTSDASVAVREYHAYFLPGKNLDVVSYELRSVEIRQRAEL